MNDKLNQTFYRKIGLFLLLISFFTSCSGGGGGNTTTPPTTFDFICPNGTKAGGTTNTANIEKCSECNAGFTINADKCTADAGTFAYVCPNGIIAGGTTITANIEKCTDCNTGFTLSSDKCVASAPSPTFAYICPNGTIAAGTTSTANVEKCTACNTNYMLSSEQCVASAPATFAYVCPNGTTADGTTSTSNIEKCTACNTNYTLSSEQCIIVNLISGGDSHTCAIRMGAAFCWGLQTDGRLGNGVATEADITTPTAVTGLASGITKISAGAAHTCAIQNGAAFCWGRGGTGQLGRGSADNSNTPVQVTGLDSGVSNIRAGNSHTCAIQNGATFCWGDGGAGKLGSANVADFSLIPVAATALTSGVTKISIGAMGEHTCAIQNGVAKCWGYGFQGRLGNGDTENQNTFVNVSDVMNIFTNNNVTSIASGEGTTCVVRNGAAFCWGYGFHGERGDGATRTTQTTAVQVTGLSSGVTDINLGTSHTCAVHNNLFKCWGHQLNGRLGNNVVTDTKQTTAVDITARFP